MAVPKTATLALATNAPRDWPPVYAEAKPNLTVDDLRVAVETHLGKSGLRQDAGRLIPSVHGVLRVDLFVEGIPTFLFPHADQAAADRFAGIRRLLRLRRFPDPVYYAPLPLPRPAYLPLLREIYDPEFVFQPEFSAPPGRYPMLRVPTEPEARKALLEAVDALYALLDGREWVGLGVVMQTLGMVDHWSDAELFKNRLVTIPLGAPGAPPAILSFRKDRGLRLHLHDRTPPTEYAGWWQWLRGFLRRRWPKGAPPPKVAPPSLWWSDVRKRIQHLPIEEVSVIHVAPR